MKALQLFCAQITCAALIALIPIPGLSYSAFGNKPGTAAQTTENVSTTGKVNINTANQAELMRLPGVGEKKAERIVAFRQRSGDFKRIKDLRRVKGFGYKSLKKLEPYLSLTGPTTMK